MSKTPWVAAERTVISVFVVVTLLVLPSPVSSIVFVVEPVVSSSWVSSFNLSNTFVVTVEGLVRSLQLGLQSSANVGLKEEEQPSVGVRTAPDALACQKGETITQVQ